MKKVDMLNIRGLWNRVRFGLAAQIGLKWNDTDTISIYKSNAGSSSGNSSEYLSHLGTLEADTLKSAKIDGVNNSLTIADLTALLTIGNDTGEIQMKGNLIRIGQPGATVLIIGSANRIESTDTEYTDAFVLLNKGGPAGSSAESGIGIYDDGNIVAFIRQLVDRDGWEMKSANDGIVRIVANAGQTSTIYLDDSDAAMAKLQDIRQLGKGVIHVTGTCAVDATDPMAPVITGITLADVGKLVMATESYSFDPGGGVVEFPIEYAIYRVIEVGGVLGIVEVYQPTTALERRLIVAEINIPSHNIVADYLYKWNGTAYVQYVPEPAALKDLTNISNSDFLAKATEAGVGVGTGGDIIVTQAGHGFTLVGTPIAKDINTGLWVPALASASGNISATAVVASITDPDNFSLSTGNKLITLTTGEWDALTGGTGGLTPGQTYYASNTAPGKYTTAIQDLINPVLLAQSATEAIVQIGFVAAESGAGNIVQHKQFTGDGVTSDFTLDAAPSSVQYIIGFVGGAYQDPSKYTLVGNTMSFATPPLNGAEINVIAIIATTFNNDISQYVQRTTLTLADDAQVILNSAGAVFPTVANGMYEVWDQSDPNTYVLLSFKQNATPVVTLRDYSPDVDSIDVDGFLCVYISGSDVILKNRLGSSKTFVIHRRI